jgi:mRNA-degrading endonuclease RelE of RelBE toxin-antitoxin system
MKRGHFPLNHKKGDVPKRRLKKNTYKFKILLQRIIFIISKKLLAVLVFCKFALIQLEILHHF